MSEIFVGPRQSISRARFRQTQNLSGSMRDRKDYAVVCHQPERHNECVTILNGPLTVDKARRIWIKLIFWRETGRHEWPPSTSLHIHMRDNNFLINKTRTHSNGLLTLNRAYVAHQDEWMVIAWRLLFLVFGLSLHRWFGRLVRFDFCRICHYGHWSIVNLYRTGMNIHEVISANRCVWKTVRRKWNKFNGNSSERRRIGSAVFEWMWLVTHFTWTIQFGEIKGRQHAISVEWIRSSGVWLPKLQWN